MRLLSLEDIHARGISFSRPHIYDLISNGKFPKPVKIGSRKNAWLESEIDQWIMDRVAQRDGVAQ